MSVRRANYRYEYWRHDCSNILELIVVFVWWKIRHYDCAVWIDWESPFQFA